MVELTPGNTQQVFLALLYAPSVIGIGLGY